MIKSAILVELSSAVSTVMPTSLEDMDRLVKQVCKLDRSVLKTLGAESLHYIEESLKAIKRGEQIPLPGDFEDTNEVRKRPKRKPPTSDEDLTFQSIECETNTNLIWVRTILDMRDHGEIDVPHFQRKSIWPVSNKQKFLRGVIKGLPIPSITLSIEPNAATQFLLDGLQRLTTLKEFVVNEIEVDGFLFSELSEKIRKKVLQANIPVNLITTDKENWPEIFLYLNTNGKPLNDMELRRAIFRHPILSRLEKISQDHELWLEMFGPPHKRYLGLSYLLRAVLMDLDYSEYCNPMTKFINRACADLDRNPDRVNADEVYLMIDKILWATRNKGRMLFRASPGGKVNQGLVDCVFHAGFSLLRNFPDMKHEPLGNHLTTIVRNLINNNEVVHALTKDTVSANSVLLRMSETDSQVISIIRSL